MSENLLLSIIGTLFIAVTALAWARVESANKKADRALEEVSKARNERLQQFLELRKDIGQMSQELVSLLSRYHEELLKDYVTRGECRYKHEGE